MTVMDLWCQFRGIQGGTIYQAFYEFKHELTDKERDSFCGKIVDNIAKISDKHHAQDFMRIRLETTGLAYVSIR